MKRSAFTLIELMAVVVVIAVLTAILIPLVGDVMSVTRRSATRATVKKIHEALQSQQDRFEREFPEWFRTTYGRDYGPANVSHVLIKKQQFRWVFLESPSVNSAGVVTPAASPADNAEILYRLVTGKINSPSDPTRLGWMTSHTTLDSSFFAAAEIGDTDGDGNLEFVDSWGQPIRYYPFPTRLFRPGGFGTPIDTTAARALYGSHLPSATLGSDPDDYFSLLEDGQVLAAMAPPVTPASFETQFHTLATYHGFLILSAGRDGSTGLFEPHDTANLGHLGAADPAQSDALHDNIVNVRDRQ